MSYLTDIVNGDNVVSRYSFKLWLNRKNKYYHFSEKCGIINAY